MTPGEIIREQSIEEVGQLTTNRLQDLEAQCEELRNYFKLIRIASTTGWKLVSNPTQDE